MGQDNSRAAESGTETRSLRSLESNASLTSLMSSAEAPTLLSKKEAELEIARVRSRIREFKRRAGTEELSADLYESWQREKERVVKTWLQLSDPGRRALIMNAREKVVSRARMLHSVVAPQNISAYNKNKIVRKLMEKCCHELFDINVVYDEKALPLLVEDVLSKHGGGNEIPVGLLMEVNNTFDIECYRYAAISESSNTGSAIWNEVGNMLGFRSESDEQRSPSSPQNYNSNMKTTTMMSPSSPRGEAFSSSEPESESNEDVTAPENTASSEMPSLLKVKVSNSSSDNLYSTSTSRANKFAKSPSSANSSGSEEDRDDDLSKTTEQKVIEIHDAHGNPSNVLVDSQSVNSLQGYYSRNAKKNARRKSSSKSIRNILSFVSEGLDIETRRKLTIETLLALRSAFLVHFAILVFSELFDDTDRVIHKYEYSDSDTDVADSATDIEEPAGEDSD